MDKREARRAFKARTMPKGVFVVRCPAAGKAWVSNSANLDAARTGMWFMLRNRMHHNRQLQAAWDSHGEAAFEFEVLEQFADDTPPLLLRDALRDRQKHWQKELGASMV